MFLEASPSLYGFDFSQKQFLNSNEKIQSGIIWVIIWDDKEIIVSGAERWDNTNPSHVKIQYPQVILLVIKDKLVF